MTDHDRMRVLFDHLGNCTGENRCALNARREAWEELDVDPVEPVGHRGIEFPRESLGYFAELLGEHTDREDAVALDRCASSTVAAQADKHSRWVGRDRYECTDRRAVAACRTIRSNYRDRGGHLTHRLQEGLAPHLVQSLPRGTNGHDPRRRSIMSLAAWQNGHLMPGTFMESRHALVL
jgi:hypothetical protein